MTKKANSAEDVFKVIDMHGGDTSVCWPFVNALSGSGRPYFSYNKRKVLAYRIVYEVFTGETLQPNEVVRHACDNEICCNPHHLSKGSHQDNMNDMKERERHGMPANTVKHIKKLLNSGQTHQEIADLFGTSRSLITQINIGAIYKDITIDDI